MEPLKKQGGAITLSCHHANKATCITLEAIPAAYDVRINGDLVFSFSSPDTARGCYDAIVKDLGGHGL